MRKKLHKDFYDEYDVVEVDMMKRQLISAFKRPDYFNSTNTLRQIRENLSYLIGEKMHYILTDLYKEPYKHSSIAYTNNFNKYTRSHLYYLAAQIDYEEVVMDWLERHTDCGHTFRHWFSKIVDFDAIQFHKDQNIEWIATAARKYGYDKQTDAEEHIKYKENMKKYTNKFFNSRNWNLNNEKGFINFLREMNFKDGYKRVFDMANEVIGDKKIAERIAEVYKSAALSVIYDFENGDIDNFDYDDFHKRVVILAEDYDRENVKPLSLRSALDIWDAPELEKLNMIESMFGYSKTSAVEFRKNESGLATNDTSYHKFRFYKSLEIILEQARENGISLNSYEEALAISVITNRIASNSPDYHVSGTKRAIRVNQYNDKVLTAIERSMQKDLNYNLEMSVRESLQKIVNLVKPRRLDFENLNHSNGIYSFRMNDKKYQYKY